MGCFALYSCILKKSYSVDGVEYYCFCTAVANEKADAYEKANETVQNGGAGVVIEEKGRFFVVASVYSNEQDAKSVANKNDGEIYTFRLPSVVTNDKNLAQKILEIYNFTIQKTNEFIKYSLAYDTNQESEIVVSAFIENYEKFVKNGQDDFYLGLASAISDKTNSVKLREYAITLLLNAKQFYQDKLSQNGV